MKTGFVKAFINIPGNKAYKYHGINKYCDIQPDPDPFIEIPIPFGPEWILMYENWPVASPFWYLHVGHVPFIHSLHDDTCELKYPDGKKIFYFIDLDYYQPLYGGYCLLGYSDGQICSFTEPSNEAGYMHFSGQYQAWAGNINLIALFCPAAPTHIRIWGSSDGELPFF